MDVGDFPWVKMVEGLVVPSYMIATADANVVVGKWVARIGAGNSDLFVLFSFLYFLSA